MAKLPSAFKTKDVDGRMNDFTPMPIGDYIAKIKSTEEKVTSATAGLPKSQQVTFISLTFEITQHEKYKGRLIFVNLNLNHEKENVVEMAEKELATICEACGKHSIDDTDELKGIEMEIKVGMTKATPQYPAQNSIKGYKPLKGIKKPELPADDDEESEDPAPKKVVKKVSFD